MLAFPIFLLLAFSASLLAPAPIVIVQQFLRIFTIQSPAHIHLPLAVHSPVSLPLVEEVSLLPVSSPQISFPYFNSTPTPTAVCQGSGCSSIVVPTKVTLNQYVQVIDGHPSTWATLVVIALAAVNCIVYLLFVRLSESQSDDLARSDPELTTESFVPSEESSPHHYALEYETDHEISVHPPSPLLSVEAMIAVPPTQEQIIPADNAITFPSFPSLEAVGPLPVSSSEPRQSSLSVLFHGFSIGDQGGESEDDSSLAHISASDCTSSAPSSVPSSQFSSPSALATAGVPDFSPSGAQTKTLLGSQAVADESAHLLDTANTVLSQNAGVLSEDLPETVCSLHPPVGDGGSLGDGADDSLPYIPQDTGNEDSEDEDRFHYTGEDEFDYTGVDSRSCSIEASPVPAPIDAHTIPLPPSPPFPLDTLDIDLLGHVSDEDASVSDSASELTVCAREVAAGVEPTPVEVAPPSAASGNFTGYALDDIRVRYGGPRITHTRAKRPSLDEISCFPKSGRERVVSESSVDLGYDDENESTDTSDLDSYQRESVSSKPLRADAPSFEPRGSAIGTSLEVSQQPAVVGLQASIHATSHEERSQTHKEKVGMLELHATRRACAPATASEGNNESSGLLGGSAGLRDSIHAPKADRSSGSLKRAKSSSRAAVTGVYASMHALRRSAEASPADSRAQRTSTTKNGGSQRGLAASIHASTRAPKERALPAKSASEHPAGALNWAAAAKEDSLAPSEGVGSSGQGPSNSEKSVAGPSTSRCAPQDAAEDPVDNSVESLHPPDDQESLGDDSTGDAAVGKIEQGSPKEKRRRGRRGGPRRHRVKPAPCFTPPRHASLFLPRPIGIQGAHRHAGYHPDVPQPSPSKYPYRQLHPPPPFHPPGPQPGGVPPNAQMMLDYSVQPPPPYYHHLQPYMGYSSHGCHYPSPASTSQSLPSPAYPYHPPLYPPGPQYDQPFPQYPPQHHPQHSLQHSPWMLPTPLGPPPPSFP
ncbi:hypothetical protein BC834DRAFT_442486 [Gloeopeniophorella convolvens]|nr:hypothetical protein BC834DRAFT_442486 [Gloeopeniophorella convolvens]